MKRSSEATSDLNKNEKNIMSGHFTHYLNSFRYISIIDCMTSFSLFLLLLCFYCCHTFSVQLPMIWISFHIECTTVDTNIAPINTINNVAQPVFIICNQKKLMQLRESFKFLCKYFDFSSNK